MRALIRSKDGVESNGKWYPDNIDHLSGSDYIKMHNLGNGAATEIGIYQLEDLDSFPHPHSPHSYNAFAAL